MAKVDIVAKSFAVDDATAFMHKVARDNQLSTVFERHYEQDPQCNFCKAGLSCQLCSDGPCRIRPGAPTGVCGADADLIVARNLLLLTAQGTVANCYHARNVAKTLSMVGLEGSAYRIKDPAKLDHVCETFGITGSSPEEKARALGKFVLTEIHKDFDEPLELVEKLAPAKRLELWKKLDILPGGPYAESAVLQCAAMTNVSNDPVDLLIRGLRLGVANEYAGLYVITVLQEILTGTATIAQGKANLGCVTEDTVNLVAHGHQPLLATLVVELAATQEYQNKAVAAGAKGIKVYGSMCEGQQLMNISADLPDRPGNGTPIFGGQLGNWIQQELVIATGVIDALFMDYNCSVPTLKQYADRFGTYLVSTDPTVRHRGVDRLEHDPTTAKQVAATLLDKAIERFGRDNRVANIPTEQASPMIGFTTESVVGALGGSIQPLIDQIAGGAIKGIVPIVGCTTAREGHCGFNIRDLAQELIKRDILVIGSGCCSSTLENTHLMDVEAKEQASDGLKGVCNALGVPPCLSYGSCTDIGKIIDTAIAIADTLGCDTSDLPVVVSAPEYLEQKAVADAFTSVAFGFTTHVAPMPMISGSPLVVDVLTRAVEELTGGKLFVSMDAVETADLMEKHILEKRAKLGI